MRFNDEEDRDVVISIIRITRFIFNETIRLIYYSGKIWNRLETIVVRLIYYSGKIWNRLETIMVRVIYYSRKIWNHLETIMVRLIYYSGKIIVSRNVYFSLWINVSHDNAPLNCDR